MKISELSQAQREALISRLRQMSPKSQALLDSTTGTCVPATAAADQRVPLTHAQIPLFAVASAHPHDSALLVPLVLHIDGPIDVHRLQEAIDALVSRHAASLTRFHEGPVLHQDIDLTSSCELHIRPVEVEHLVNQSLAACKDGFDLASPPFMRATLFTTGKQHRLVLLWHHLVTDGWSLQRWIDELPFAYDGEIGSVEVRDPLTYHRWEASQAGRDVLEKNAQYWRSELEKVEGKSQLPLEVIDAVQRNPLEVAVPIPFGLDRGLKQLASTLGATPAAAYLGFVAAVWGVCSDTRQMVVGIAGGNRNLGIADDVCGLRSQLLPAVLELTPHFSFAETIQCARRVLLGALEHEPVPLADPRIARHLPDIAVMLALTTSTPERLVLGDAIATVVPVQVQGSQSPLTVLVDDGDPEQPEWRLSRSLGSDIDLDALAEVFARLLPRFLESPGAPLARFCASGSGVLTGLDPSAHPAVTPSAELASEALVRHAAESPDALAVRVDRGPWVRYRELDRRAQALASVLRAQGVVRGDRVAVAVGRTVDHIVALHAIWRLSACAVPLRLDDPPERISTVTEHADVRVVIAARPVPGASRLPHVSPQVRSDSRLGETFPMPSADEAAYIVFTSGTTGVPKPVVVAHAALANELQWRVKSVQLAPTDRILETIPLSFDPAFWQCLGALMVGGSVVILNEDLGLFPQLLVSAAREHEATIVDVVPSLLASLTDEDLTALPARVVYCGGEALPAQEAARYLAHGRGKLYNVYGPSETCIDSTYFHCRPDNLGLGNVPIGRAVDNVRVYVLDGALRPVLPGQVGDLYVGGAGVSWGYLGKGRATASSFLPDPFGPTVGARMYATGDKVRQRADGALEFRGRADQQVKIRGHRVEPGEVDAVLRDVSGIPRVTTLMTAGRLVAFVETSGHFDSHHVLSLMAGRLPKYMLPSKIMTVDSIPLTRHGKVDRTVLEQIATPESSIARNGDQFSAAVRHAFEQVMGSDHIGEYDDLYALGGASLGAARIAGILREGLGTALRVEAVLAHPSIHALTTHLRATCGSGDASPVAQLPGARWVLDLEEALGSEVPPVCHLIVFDQEMKLVDVTRCLNALLHRHPGLAADSSEWSSGLCQAVFLPSEDNPQELLDDPQWCEVPINAGSPALHAVLFGELERGRHLLLRIRRRCADGMSAMILERELRTLLSGGVLGKPPQWPPKMRVEEPAAVEYARALGDLRRDPWAEMRPPKRSFINHGVYRTLAPDIADAVSAACRRERVLPVSVYIAATTQALAHFMGESPTIIGSPIDRRDTTELQGTVARLVDLVPVPVRSGQGIGATHKAVVKAMERCTLGIGATRELIDPHADLLHRPAVCGVAVSMEVGEGVVAHREEGHVVDHWADLDLVVHVSPTLLTFSVNSDIFDIHSAHELADIWMKQLQLLTSENEEYLLRNPEES